MPSLFDYQKQKKLARDFYDQYGMKEGAVTDPRGRAFLEQYYQEPTASPILERGALNEQLANVDAIRRQLMARGMNAVQAEDAAERTIEQQRQSIRGSGMYDDWVKEQEPPILPGSPAMQTGVQRDESGNVIPRTPFEPELTEDEFVERELRRQMIAPDVSATAKADYEVGTLDARIKGAKAAVEQLIAELPERISDASLNDANNKFLKKQQDILFDPASSTDDILDAVARIKRAQLITNPTRSSTGVRGPGHGPQPIDFLTHNQQAELSVLHNEEDGTTTYRRGNRDLIVPTDERLTGDYPTRVTTQQQ